MRGRRRTKYSVEKGQRGKERERERERIYIYIATCYSKVLVVAPYCSKFLKLLRFGTFDVEHVFCVLSYFSTFHIFDVNALRWKCYQPMKFGEKIYILHLWALEEMMD